MQLGVTSGHVGVSRLPVSVDKRRQRWLGPRNQIRRGPIPWNRGTRRSRRSQKLATTFAVSNTCSNDDHSRRSKHSRLSLFAIFATFCSRDPSSSISGSSHGLTTRLTSPGHSLLPPPVPYQILIEGAIEPHRLPSTRTGWSGSCVPRQAERRLSPFQASNRSILVCVQSNLSTRRPRLSWPNESQ